MAVSAAEYAQRILEVQACSNGGCACQQSLRRGHGLTHCFIHNDPGPSLNVSVKSGELLVHCQAGCDQRLLVAQLRDQEMFPPVAEAPSARASIVAEYDYVDEQGTLLFQALRYHPKAFKQRRPDPAGGWLWSLNGVRQVTYRLPEILSNPDRLVFVAEGEKDVDRLRAEGFLATCNAGGAGKWTADHASHLKGRRVVIVVDNDEPGRAHGRKVARTLQGIAQGVQWLELPGLQVKGDVSDWFDAGHTADELKELVRVAEAPPSEALRTTVFEKVGLNYRFMPERAPIVATFGRLTDRRDDVSAEIKITDTRGKTLVSPRRVNLLGASGVPPSIVQQLERADLGVDKGLWQEILGEGFECVIHARRNGLEVRRVGGNIKQPQPPAWFCYGLVLKGVINVWVAAAGTGKSTAAKALAVHAAAGRNFLGRFTEQAATLYLDWEDDQENFERYAVEICHGMDVWPVPDMFWIAMRGKRLRDNIERISQLVEEHGIGLIVIDAVAVAGGDPGEHRGYEGVALELEECLGQLPAGVTVLALDHITSDEHRNRNAGVPSKARGAERKVEYTRNQWTMMLDHELREVGQHMVSWHHTKINVGRYLPQFTTEFVHGEGSLEILERDITASPEAVKGLSLKRQNELWVLEHPGCTAEQVCMGVRGNTSANLVEATRTQLKRSAERGTIEKDAAGAFWPPKHPEMPRQLGGDLPFEAES